MVKEKGFGTETASRHFSEGRCRPYFPEREKRKERTKASVYPQEQAYPAGEAPKAWIEGENPPLVTAFAYKTREKVAIRIISFSLPLSGEWRWK